jgi:hypothetical protein
MTGTPSRTETISAEGEGTLTLAISDLRAGTAARVAAAAP